MYKRCVCVRVWFCVCVCVCVCVRAPKAFASKRMRDLFQIRLDKKNTARYNKNMWCIGRFSQNDLLREKQMMRCLNHKLSVPKKRQCHGPGVARRTANLTGSTYENAFEFTYNVLYDRMIRCTAIQDNAIWYNITSIYDMILCIWYIIWYNTK